MAEQPRGARQRPFFRQIAVWLSLRRLAAVNKSLRLVHSVPVEVDEWSRELLHVHSSTLGDPYTVAKPPIGANHGVADFATPQRLTELDYGGDTQSSADRKQTGWLTYHH